MEEVASFDTRICIKVKFFAQMSRMYGVVTIVFGDSLSYIEEAGINISSYSMAYNQVTNSSSFSEFYAIVTDLKDTLHSHRKTYFTLKNTIEKDLTFLEKFSKTKGKKTKSKNLDIMELESDLKELIRRAINDKKIVIFVAIEQVPTEQFLQLQSAAADAVEKAAEEKYTEVEEELEEEVQDFFAIDSNSTIADYSPVVSPVGGLPVAGISEGDIIYATLGARPKNTNNKDAFNDKNKPQGRSGAIKVTVIRAAFQDGLHKILVQVDEKNYGKIEETESVKVKVAKKKAPIELEKPQKKSGKYTVFLLIFVLLLFLSAMYFLITII